MIVKTHEAYGKIVLAICDDELLGKIFEEKDLILDMSSRFFAGQKVDDIELMNFIKKAHIINAVGEKCIRILIENNIITKKDVKRINNIPNVQILLN